MKNNKVKIIEDKKTFFVSIAVFILFYIFLTNFWFYPSPPIDSMSTKEVIDRLEKSESGFVKIATEGKYDWYLSEDFFILENHVFSPLSNKGWVYKETHHTYKKNGVHTGYEETYSKTGAILKLEVYYWVKGYQFLKIDHNIDF